MIVLRKLHLIEGTAFRSDLWGATLHHDGASSIKMIEKEMGHVPPQGFIYLFFFRFIYR